MLQHFATPRNSGVTALPPRKGDQMICTEDAPRTAQQHNTHCPPARKEHRAQHNTTHTAGSLVRSTEHSTTAQHTLPCRLTRKASPHPAMIVEGSQGGHDGRRALSFDAQLYTHLLLGLFVYCPICTVHHFHLLCNHHRSCHGNCQVRARSDS